MELWIRSADKEVLLKVNVLEIEENMIIAFDDSKYQCLGTYKTKERALEVLDEIQRILQPRLIANVRATEEMEELIGSMSVGKILKQDIDIKQLSTVVYEMPKE